MKQLIILVVLFIAPAFLFAQEDTVFTLDVNVDLVELHVSVTDTTERPVGGLLKEHFKILENRVPQEIAVFKHEDRPVSLGLVIDNSRSIEPRKARLDSAAVAFVRGSNPEDETFIVHFDDEARITNPFTSSISDLESSLQMAKPFGQTAIYDAVMLAVDEMENAKYQKKVMLLITDGLDNVSKHTLDEAIEALRRSRVALYTVGLLSVSGGADAEDSLVRLAEATGGRAYFPENVEEAAGMIQRVARDLREQYTIGYFPTNPNRDGAWRSVRVEITPPPGFPTRLDANYRYGYYGPQEQE
jgi:Ca-activated chloride channel family protein